MAVDRIAKAHSNVLRQRQEQQQQPATVSKMATAINPMEILEALADFVEKKQHWVLIVGFDMTDIVDKIDAQYYHLRASSSAGFHVMMLPFPVVVFAAKKQMSHDQLMRLLIRETGRAWAIAPDADMVSLVNKGDKLGEMACERLVRQVRSHIEVRRKQKTGV